MGDVTWLERERVLPPTAAYARGPLALALAKKLIDWPADRLDRLSGVSAGDVVVVLAKTEEDLPWIDGVRYLGRDPAAPQLLLPTALAPSVHSALFERAIAGRARTIGLIAVLPDPPQAIIPLKNALPLSIARLRAFLGERA